MPKFRVGDTIVVDDDRKGWFVRKAKIVSLVKGGYYMLVLETSPTAGSFHREGATILQDNLGYDECFIRDTKTMVARELEEVIDGTIED